MTYKTSIVKQIVYQVEFDTDEVLEEDEAIQRTIQAIEDDDIGVYEKSVDWTDFDIDGIEEDDFDDLDEVDDDM